MKKFKFKLEGFLKLRHIEEQKKMAELASVIGRVESEKNEISNYFDESRRLLREEALKARDGVFDMQYSRALMNYFYVLEKKRKVAERNIEELQQELLQKQQEANFARRNRRVIELVKEKKQREHQKQVLDEENKMLDEFNQNRA